VLHRRGVARDGLGDAELAQHLPAHAGRGRLDQGAAQVGDRGIGRTAIHRDACRRTQRVDEPRVLQRASGQDMRRDTLDRRARVAQERGGRRVSGLAPRCREVGVDRPSHHRVREPHGILVAQDLGAREQPCGVRRATLVEPCHAGSIGERTAVADDRQRRGETRRVVADGSGPP
jgi:hypothetical protein